MTLFGFIFGLGAGCALLLLYLTVLHATEIEYQWWMHLCGSIVMLFLAFVGTAAGTVMEHSQTQTRLTDHALRR